MSSYLRWHGETEKSRGTWIWELMALSVSVVSLLAIIVIVSTYHGKPLARLPLGITLNAAISIMATIMKTTVLYCAAQVISQSKWIWFYHCPQRLSDVELYDQASRGPWGALFMLWRVRWKDLSSLAALVIVYSLAIDPFAQQVTHFRPERVVVDSEASIPIQSIFSGSDSLLDAESAVQSAFSGSNIPETVSHCPSGNCSWSSYPSLAVCHKCVDISDLIQIKDTCFYQKTAGCSAYLENGLTIELGNTTNSSDTTRMMTKSTGPLLKIDDVSQSLINFTKLYQDPDSLSVKPDCYYREQSFISQCLADIRRTLAATECSLHWCINHYFARQESGVLEESVTDSWWSHLGTDIVTVMEPGDEDGIGMTLGDHIQLLPPKEEVNSSENGQKLGRDDTNPAQGNISTRRPASYDPCFIWIYANHVLVDWLDKFFIRELTSIDTTGFNSLDSDTDDVAIVSGQNKRPSGEISGAHQPDPVFDMFSNVAFGLTQFIRRDRHSLTGTEKANGHSVEVDGEIYKLKFTAPGTVFEDRTVVQVRWAWLCFPVGLVAMTVFLTIATKIRSSKQQIPIWGSSTTALMIRGPYSHTNEISPLSLSADQMHQKAKSTKVTLERSTDGSWRLVERRDAAIRDEATDLESAVSFLPHSTTQEMREHPNPTGTSTEMATESLLAASGTRGGEATVTAWNPRQKPRAGRSQSF